MRPEVSLIHVAAAIIWRDENFLAALRPEGKPMAGYWEFPGGKIKEGESPLMALCRECNEELGITPEEAVFLFCRKHTYLEENFSVCLHFFLIRKWDHTPFSREGQQLLWVSPLQALGMNFLPADMEVVNQLYNLVKMGGKLQDLSRGAQIK